MAEIEQAPPEGPKKNGNGNGNGKPKTFMIVLLVVAAVAGVAYGTKWFMHRLAYTTTDDAQVDANLLPISSKVPGRIVKMYVGEGDKVKPGQVIAEIDPTDYNFALARAESGLEAARLDLEKAQSAQELTDTSTSADLEKAESALSLTDTSTLVGVQQSESSLKQSQHGVNISSIQQDVNSSKLQKDVERAQVNVQRAADHLDEVQRMYGQAKEDAARARKLFDGGVISKAQLDMANTNRDASEARVEQVKQENADAAKQLELAQSNRDASAIDTQRVTIANRDESKAGLSVNLSKKQRAEGLRTARKQLSLSQKQREEGIKTAQKNVELLQSKVKDMETAVEQARTALAETKIVSPVTGVVAKKTSEMTELVSTGKPIFFILDTSSVWVTANIEETNIHKLRLGSTARITVDALPGREYAGTVIAVGAATVDKFALIPQSNSSGQFIKVTERVPVKISITGDMAGLSAGMNVIVEMKNQ